MKIEDGKAANAALTPSFKTDVTVEVQKKTHIDDAVSTRWFSWMATKCAGLNKEGQSARKCTRLEDFFNFGLLIFEAVKRVLPPLQSGETNGAASPPRAAAMVQPTRQFALKAVTPRGISDQKKPSYSTRSGAAREAAATREPARTLWELAEAGWGGYAGKKDAFAGLRLLVERQPDIGRQLPPADQIEARAPRACRQVVAVLRTLAVIRAQGDVHAMMEWFRAAVTPYGTAVVSHLPASDGAGGAARPLPPGLLWTAFRDGVVWACALHAAAHLLQTAVAATAGSAADSEIDLRGIYGDPRTLEELGSNLSLALLAMAGMGLPVLWAPGEAATYPGDDDAFLLLQVRSTVTSCH